MADPIRRVIAIDPGLLTGVGMVDLVPGDDDDPVESATLEKRYSAELGFEKVGVALTELLGDSDPESTDVVVERFTITAKTAKNSQAPWSLEVIGMCRWIMLGEFGDRFGEMIMQGPAEAKTLIPNDVLKRAGIWHVGGEGHANDALRHALYRFVRTTMRVRDGLWQLD